MPDSGGIPDILEHADRRATKKGLPRVATSVHYLADHLRITKPILTWILLGSLLTQLPLSPESQLSLLCVSAVGMVRGPLPVEVDIKDGEIVKSGNYTHEVEPGTILGILDLKIKDDRIELSCRTAEPAHQVQRLGGIHG